VKPLGRFATSDPPHEVYLHPLVARWIGPHTREDVEREIARQAEHQATLGWSFSPGRFPCLYLAESRARALPQLDHSGTDRAELGAPLVRFILGLPCSRILRYREPG